MASALKLLQSWVDNERQQTDAMNAYYQTIKNIKQQLGVSPRSPWLSGAALVVTFKFAISWIQWGRLACVSFMQVCILCFVFKQCRTWF